MLKKIFVAAGIGLVSVASFGGIAAGVLSSANKPTTRPNVTLVPTTTFDSIQQAASDFLESLTTKDFVITNKHEVNDVNKTANNFVFNLNASEITTKNLVSSLHNSTTTITKPISDFYSFNVDKSQIKLANTKQIPNSLSEYSIEINLINDKNTTSSLNDGKLFIEVSFKSGNSLLVSPVEIELNGFKQPTNALKSLLIDKTNSLDLDKLRTNGQANNYLTIEQLNSVEPSKTITKLATLIQEGIKKVKNPSVRNVLHKETVTLEKTTTHQAEKEKKITVPKIKLLSIAKDEKQATKFYLGVEENTPFKISYQNEDGSLSQILIDNIQFSKLLPSSLLVIPSISLAWETTNFIEELKKVMPDGDKYMVEERKDLPPLLSVDVPKTPPEKDNKVKVYITPYLINKTVKDTDKLPFNLSLSYGSDDSLKTYLTSRPSDLKELKESGIKFNIYSKKLECKEKMVKASSIVDSSKNKLESFFQKEFLTTASKIPANGTNSTKTTDGMFYVTKLDDESKIDIDFSVMLQETPMQKVNKQAKAITQEEEKKEEEIKKELENFILFATYSYSDFGSDKSMITPNLSLVQIRPIENNNKASGEVGISKSATEK